jgi:glycosyltransferase involved in cell wall biosynthesis
VADKRYRLLVVPSHPVQYASANFRQMARHPGLDPLVAYCSLRGAEAGPDPEFGTTVQWDVPLLDGYPWVSVENKGNGLEGFWGLRNPDLWKIVREGNFDALLCLTSYRRASFWICYFAARTRRIPFFFGTDASTIEPRDQRGWKRFIKRLTWPMLFRLASQVVVVSTPGFELVRSLGIPPERIALLHNTVDNDWWLSASERVDRAAVRSTWGVSEREKIIVFCAKLQQWKRPLDLLRAFAKAGISESTLLIAGEGPLRLEIEAEIAALGLGMRARVLGFVNQSRLPSLYTAADLMVLPSEYEPFAMVVNEAMLCGCPVMISDHVGAAHDLVEPVFPDFVFPCGNLEAIASTLRHAFSDPERLKLLRQAARKHMENWSPRENVAAVYATIERALALRGGSSDGKSVSNSISRNGTDTRQVSE